jgi:thioredoxin-dependent peroxiredoxin
MTLRLGDIFPDFSEATSQKYESFYRWIKGSWFMLIINLDVHSNETLVELLSGELKERDLKSLVLTNSHKDDKFYYYGKHNDSVPPSILEKIWLSLCLSAEDYSTKILIIDPNKNIRSILTYSPFSIRNMDETFNVLDTIRLCESQFPGSTEEQLIAPAERELKSRRSFLDTLLLPLN